MYMKKKKWGRYDTILKNIALVSGVCPFIRVSLVDRFYCISKIFI